MTTTLVCSNIARRADAWSELAGTNAFYGSIYELGDGKPFRDVIAWERLNRLGFEFLGPQAPDRRRQSDTLDESIGPDSLNVPTDHTTRQKPETASGQLDDVSPRADSMSPSVSAPSPASTNGDHQTIAAS